MGRPPVIPAEQKTRIVLSVLAGEMTIAEAARREKVSEQSIGRWKADFLEAGKTALAAGRSGPSTREQQLEAEVADLTQALGEAAVDSVGLIGHRLSAAVSTIWHRRRVECGRDLTPPSRGPQRSSPG